MNEGSLSQGTAQYIQSLEARIVRLEDRIAESQAALQKASEQIDQLGSLLPKSNIINKSFLWRAFAVWGHYFVAQILIAIPIYCIFIAIGFGLSDF